VGATKIFDLVGVLNPWSPFGHPEGSGIQAKVFSLGAFYPLPSAFLDKANEFFLYNKVFSMIMANLAKRKIFGCIFVINQFSILLILLICIS